MKKATCWDCGIEIEIKMGDARRCADCQEKHANKPLKVVDVKDSWYSVSYSAVALVFTLVNIIIFLYGWIDEEDLIYRGAIIHFYILNNNEYFRLFTSTFLHFGAMHLGSNMLSLNVLGKNMAKEIGEANIFFVYMLSGFGGSMAVLLFASNFSITAGASGAVCGLLGFAVAYSLKKNRMGELRNNTLLVWTALLIMQPAVMNVSWLGHLGGFVTGAAIGLIFRFVNMKYNFKWITISLAILTVLTGVWLLGIGETDSIRNAIYNFRT
jgi:membrane associated rhomboid family serine protease